MARRRGAEIPICMADCVMATTIGDDEPCHLQFADDLIPIHGYFLITSWPD